MAHRVRLGEECLFNYTEALSPTEDIWDPRYGVYISGFALKSSINILNTTFTTNIEHPYKNVQGIRLQGGNVGAGTKISITDCDWNFSSAFSTGIQIEGTFPEQCQFQIFNNEFDVLQPVGTHAAYGIRCRNGDKNYLAIYNNDLSV